jgi:hypothetical protein
MKAARSHGLDRGSTSGPDAMVPWERTAGILPLRPEDMGPRF